MKKTLFVLLFILISGIVNGQSRLKWYRDYQASVEWNNWIESHPKKRIEVVKAAVTQSRDISSKKKKSARLRKKEDRIRQRIRG